MKRRLAILVFALLTIGAIFSAASLWSSGSTANADSEDQTFRWLAGAGVVDFPAPGTDVCDLVLCPDIATSFNSESIEIRGEGTLRVGRGGEPKDVDGGGVFTHNFAAGGSASGTWKAKRLLMFDSYGPGPGFPEAWNAGRALILVRLEAGGMQADGILEIGCRLGPPGGPGGGIQGTIEGVRLVLSGGLNFSTGWIRRPAW